MKRVIIFATAYPYVSVILGVIWISSALLLKIDPSLSLNNVLIVNVLVSLVIAKIGFKN